MKDKVVLITGASGGVGTALANDFYLEMCKLALHYNKNSEKADEMKQHFNCITVQADIGNSFEVYNMISKVVSHYGRIDILINNAGIHDDNLIWKMTDEQWNRVIATNLTGPFLAMKNVIPYMRKQQFGRIINISSVVGQIGVAGTSNYAASKAGLMGLTRAVAKEMVLNNVTVNALSLGYFNTGLFKKLSEPVQQQVVGGIPMARTGNMEELTSMVLFLCSEDASYITGQNIHLNGGLYM